METRGPADLKFPVLKSGLIGENHDCQFVLSIEREMASRTSLLNSIHRRGLDLDKKDISCTTHESSAGCSMNDGVGGLARFAQVESSVWLQLQVGARGDRPANNAVAVRAGGHGVQQR